jgi:2-polyprenyl-3-methyl-5-hydroxy-6-metoxy-1,4-benzoquinol methylase
MRDPVFVTTIYGEAYTPFVAPHLHAIRQRYPRAEGVVVWQSVPRAEIDLLTRAYPSWRFIESADALSGDLHQRIPRKLHAWKRAAELHPDRPLAFLDCDTLLVRRLDEFFTGGWDIIYTWKDELFPINTGVILASSGRAAAALFQTMVDRVERIVREPRLLETALGSSGAADQHALREIVGFCSYDRYTVKTLHGRELVFRGVPCRYLNETNCRPISDDLCLIHYKTGWHPILLEGKDWTPNRPLDRCRDMYRFWNQTREASNAALARGVVLSAAAAARERFAPLADGYEERGILNSEMLAACSVCSDLRVDLVIESGRARGQSTYVLARWFRGTPTRIISLELERDGDAVFAEERLHEFANVELRYGDSLKLLPEIIAAHPGRRIAVLLDGPKGKAAIDLMRRAFAQSPDVLCGFIHDMRRQTPQREALDAAAGRTFFTDDDEFVREHRPLDQSCLPRGEITVHTWRPNMKGRDTIPSYGPTLAVMFPPLKSGLSTHGPNSGPNSGPATPGVPPRAPIGELMPTHRIPSVATPAAPVHAGGEAATATLAAPRLKPDATPNRFLSGKDWKDPRYAALMDEIAALYRDEMQGEPHPYGAKNPSRIITHWSREWEYPWAILNARLRPGMAVADLGCGGSPLAIWLARRMDCRTTGIDQNFLSKTKRNNLRGFVKPPSELVPEVAWLQESMTETSLAPASQDRVLCISVLEHVPTDVANATFRETVRILKPGGLFLVTTDVGGDHRTLTSTYQELIQMGRDAGLALEGRCDWSAPDATPGTYDVVGFVMSKP